MFRPVRNERVAHALMTSELEAQEGATSFTWNTMRRLTMKPFVKPLAAAGLAAALLATAGTPSFARDRAWVAAGAGFLAGTIIGATAANANAYYYGGPYGYYDSYAYAPTYVEPYAYAPAYAYAPVYAGPRYYYRESAREKHLTSPNY
jgi:hypothetical protein